MALDLEPRSQAALGPASVALRPPRTRLERHGADACGDDELLAIALGEPALPPRVREMMERHGGVAGLERALSIAPNATGVGRARAARVAAIAELGRRMASAWPEPEWIIRAPGDVAERLMPALGGLEREELHVLTLNSKNAVTSAERLYVGTLAGSSVRVGEVFCSAVRRRAAAVVVVHNHPSGDPSPSAEDLRITGELAQAGRLLDIDLLDHVVIGRGRWVSLRALGSV